MCVIHWKDTYEYSPHRIVLTPEQLAIPGVRCFGWQNDTSARSPLPPHIHENAFELTLIVDGAYSFQSGQQTHLVQGGELFVAYPNEVHDTNRLPLSAGEFYWIQFDLSDLSAFLFLDEKAAQNLMRRFFRFSGHIRPFPRQPFLLLLQQAFSCACQQEETSACLCASYLTVLLNLLCTDLPDTAPSLTADIRSVLSYIQEHIREELPLEELAARTGLSLSQFKKKFRSQTGSAPRTYINRLKIEQAKALLLEGQKITDVAMQLSFGSSNYFSSVFRKYMYCSPSEFAAMERPASPVSECTKDSR